MAVCRECGQVLEGYVACPDCGISLEAHKKLRIRPDDIVEMYLPVEVVNEQQWREIEVGERFAVLCRNFKNIDNRAVISIDELTILIRVEGPYSEDIAEIIDDEDVLIQSEKVSDEVIKMIFISLR